MAVGLVAASLLGAAGIPRILLAVGFLFFVPGRAVTANWSQLAFRSQAAQSMLFSLVILALAATIALWARYWHPVGLMQAEAGLSLFALAVAAARRHRYLRPGPSATTGTTDSTAQTVPARGPQARKIAQARKVLQARKIRPPAPH